MNALINKPIKYLLVFLFILVSFKPVNKSEYYFPEGAYSICASNIDLDNDIDIIIGYFTSSNSDTAVTISLNNGNGTLDTAFTTLYFNGYQYDIFAQNIDADTLPDIVAFRTDVTNGNPIRYIRVYYNDNGSFYQFNDFPLLKTNPFNGKTYGDVDNDNDIDILVASSNGQFWGILYNDGTGQLSSPEYFDVSEYFPLDLECGNLNNDNRNDVLLTGIKTEIYFSYPSGFENVEIDDYANNEVEIADMDNDGDNDIVAIRCWGSTYLFIYENLGNGSFIKHTAGVFNEFYSYYLETGDLNNDSLPDAICTDDYGIHVLLNKSDFIFGEPEFYTVSYQGSNGTSYCSDLNNDGWNDIATIVYPLTFYGSILTLFYNDGTGHFIPNPPTYITENKNINNPELKVYPNPFKYETTISFSLNDKQYVELYILDLNGEIIKTLKNNLLEKGEYKFVWNGYDNNGLKCLPCVYLVLFKTNNKSESIKLLLIN